MRRLTLELTRRRPLRASVAGSLQGDGTWSVRFRLTSHYQYRDGVNLPVPLTSITVYGARMRHLEKAGRARNFREIGAGTLAYTDDGSSMDRVIRGRQPSALRTKRSMARRTSHGSASSRKARGRPLLFSSDGPKVRSIF